MNTLGEYILVHRKRLKLSQRDLGKLINVTNSAISTYETGQCEPSYRKALAIANVLGFNLSDLPKK